MRGPIVAGHDRQAAAHASGDPVAALEARFVDVVDRVSPTS